MEAQASDVVVGLMMSAFGMLGLFLAAGSHDVEMYIFGLALAGFAVLFVGGQIRRRFNEAEALALVRQEGSHD